MGNRSRARRQPYCYGPTASGCMPTPQRIRSRLMQMPAVRRCGQCRGPWHVARCTALQPHRGPGPSSRTTLEALRWRYCCDARSTAVLRATAVLPTTAVLSITAVVSTAAVLGAKCEVAGLEGRRADHRGSYGTDTPCRTDATWGYRILGWGGWDLVSNCPSATCMNMHRNHARFGGNHNQYSSQSSAC